MPPFPPSSATRSRRGHAAFALIVTLLAAACSPLPDIGDPALPTARQSDTTPPRLVPIGPALAAAESGALDADSGPALAARAAALRARGAALRNQPAGG